MSENLIGKSPEVSPVGAGVGVGLANAAREAYEIPPECKASVWSKIDHYLLNVGVGPLLVGSLATLTAGPEVGLPLGAGLAANGVFNAAQQIENKELRCANKRANKG